MSGTKKTTSGLVDDWQARKTVTECNLRMLETEDCSDATFRLGPQKQVVRAHSYVLVSRSCVFKAMLCGPLAEKGEITIPDIELDIFKEFLRYVYTDEATINAETVTGLMYTSRKYSLDGLYDLCVAFMDESLSEDNVCQILEECHGYGELDLEQKALEILTEGGERVTKSPGFVGLCSDCLGKFLKSETLNLKEEDIFEAVLSWTKERCRTEGVCDTPENGRRLLDDMRYEIRFTSMPLEYLVKVVGPSGLLTVDEKMRIIDRAVDTTVDISPFRQSRRNATQTFAGNLNTQTVTRTQNTPGFTFGTTSNTQTVTGNLNASCKIVNRFSLLSSWELPAGQNAISFTPSESILLYGCQLYGGHDAAEYALTIRVYDANKVVLCEPFQDTVLYIQKKRQLNDVVFEKCVSLTAGATYTLYVDMEGPATCCGLYGMDTVTVGGVQFTFTDSPMSTTITSTGLGQIPGLIFCPRS
ncbi:BTB/POZ domain-containing protein 6-like [Haliotis rubra]|uniref:BTB/POZ domain-containing protein 6-like n=1 Tax=Haliotis rubra TaxID=36100 RepID=UPI001EE5FC03|nr:BTB/POZ domain-containing protein 6-like [Haliotis rubra]